MQNNNNPWSVLTRPIIDRPGTATATPKPTAAPTTTRERGPVTSASMPAADVAQAHAEMANDPWVALLSPRQHQVLDMLVQGMSNKQIALTIGISPASVSKYTAGIKERLKVQTLAQAVVAWHRHYRALQPDAALGNKDDTLIANLSRATQALAADRKEAA